MCSNGNDSKDTIQKQICSYIVARILVEFLKCRFAFNTPTENLNVLRRRIYDRSYYGNRSCRPSLSMVLLLLMRIVFYINGCSI